jgi:Malectin domain
MRKLLVFASLFFAVATSAQIRVTTSTTAYKDSQGNTWSPDTTTAKGGLYGTVATHAIANALPSASDQPLYQPQRYGIFTETFPVTNGTYSVTLKFAETFMNKAGERVFNVTINGTTVLSAFDVFAAAGGEYIAVDKTFPVVVTTGSIVVGFPAATVNNSFVDSISVLPVTPPVPPVITSTGATSTIGLACGTATPPPAAQSVTLTWAPSSSTQVTSYNVYRSTTNGGPTYTKIGSSTLLTFTDATVTGGVTYYYVVTAVAPACSSGSTTPCGESGYSNQASATIP